MAFNYDTAFIRNVGIITQEEQNRLRKSRVGIAGCGGMGGFYAEALARMGIGSFVLADGDTFEQANFNRQLGATMLTVGKHKAVALRERILSINPDAKVDVCETYLDAGNIAGFLEGCNLVMNAIEAFEIGGHRLLFSESRKRGLYVVFGAPLGLSGIVLVMDPNGMTADEYFDWYDGQDNAESLAGFLVGMAPKGLQAGQLNIKDIDVEQRNAPSCIAACLLGSGWAMTDALRILTGRPVTRPVPHYVQVDGYSGRMASGYLPYGLRSPIQRWKRGYVLKKFLKVIADRKAAAAAGKS